MKRRDFLKKSGLLSFSPAFVPGAFTLRAAATEAALNPNWADPGLGARAFASSSVTDPPNGYTPASVLGERLKRGWQADGEAAGAWLEIAFDQPRPVREIWIMAAPLKSGIEGEDSYTTLYSRESLRMAPRLVRIGFSGGGSHSAELRQTGSFQIVALPRTERTASLRFVVEEVWPKPGGKETGLAKVRVFERAHEPSFEVAVHRMYDARGGQPVQAATLTLANPGAELRDTALRISRNGRLLVEMVLEPTPANAVFDHSIWIPAPFENCEMTFEVVSKSSPFECRRVLQVPRYRSLFDGGTFEIDCTNHNDLGFLSTPQATADYRSSYLILPALELMRKYPEFRYSMESTIYLSEFLERHPERREEMARRMRERRFVWGASYVQLLEYSGGPERLVRQFYRGRRWLRKEFPGADTRIYYQTDPPCLTQQMPQLLALAGVRYCLLGRLPFGFFDWQSPEGTSIRVFGYRYYDAGTLLDPSDLRGWLRFADERESYYGSHHLPRRFIYNYTSDYLPPQPEIVPYVRRENARMQAFAEAWNRQSGAKGSSRIDPPRITFTTAEKYLGELDAGAPALPTLRGEWPTSWAYYDEPGNREALRDGRYAHNQLLAAERGYAAVGAVKGFAGYPAAKFAEAWQANLWPDHGWGGNRGVETDRVYAESYAKSKRLSTELLAAAGTAVARPGSGPGTQIPIAVFNCLSWPRTDLVEYEAQLPGEWPGWRLLDEHGKQVAVAAGAIEGGKRRIAFVAEDVPAMGCRNYVLERSEATPYGDTALAGGRMENRHYLLAFGAGGIKSLYDKQRRAEVLRTSKYDGGEILQFTALGTAWEEPQKIGMADFDRTANHDFPIVSMTRTPIGAVAVREAAFAHFRLRQQFRIYDDLPRVDIDVELLDWDGAREIELRSAFPVELGEARFTYETPFGAAEIGKDEIDYSLLPSNAASQFYPQKYGGPLGFRQAINWIDASSSDYGGGGVMAASDSTVHLFHDPAGSPANDPVLQHVLLASRKSLAWNPQYWFTQKGSHRYRMTLLPHAGNWRERYRDAIGFNYRLIAFEGVATGLPGLRLEPYNLVLTALKKSEDDDRLVIRFYEAEGNHSHARIKLPRPVRRAWRADLLEEDGSVLPVAENGDLELAVRAWEIVTLKLEV